ncbi:2-oxoglutarate ferredoxin oxidoreductase subunit alpha [Desulfotomaculum arcticum]|uniref:2-oxoglutarate ferredoxin oxidoreductase subunit alpha n=1 Tax=Desulfotruncus arcticus DSM 17038 TaxID=1121424 RepID=A0A1I2YNU7_9FIRM|nr:2-oxoacid:acceptor oxidoreductase subunit alpha [Desulfotruncus arcticus]SFH27190.1 2-oxoglutarate ferredoxin oxidoreductase subunit alpha [Desulfotomaculum arcticum] [Desulfotruncus arcticus DSM 17038]
MRQEVNNENVKILQGNEAIVEAAIAAGCRFFAGYPITPASEVAETMAQRLPQVDGVFMQMEDEIASICATIGASFGGLKACTASSGPGISLKQEGVGYASAVEAPIVVINVMRGGPATGMPTAAGQQDIMQAKYGSHGDYEIISLMPSSSQEAFDLTYKAFELSEHYRVPVYVLSDEIVGHTREKVRIPANLAPVERKKPAKDGFQPYEAQANGLLDGMPGFNEGYRLLIDGQLHDEQGNRAAHLPDVCARLTERLCRKITDHANQLVDIESSYLEDAEIIVVSFGSPSRPSLRAVKDARARGIKAGYLKLRIIWPFPESKLVELTTGAHTLIVPELNIGRVVNEVKRAVGGRKEVISLSKLGGILHTPGDIQVEIERRVRSCTC